jgi:hypothetical protein
MDTIDHLLVVPSVAIVPVKLQAQLAKRQLSTPKSSYVAGLS